jgi:hypothetical protein
MYSIEVQLTGNGTDIYPKDYVNSTSLVTSVNGRIGNVVISAEELGLSLVDNTSDLDKPISTKTLAALEQLELRINQRVQLAQLDFSFYPNSGVDQARIDFPDASLPKPKSVVCEIENNIDNVIYNHNISHVSESGFFLNFSDLLSEDGYVIHVSASF